MKNGVYKSARLKIVITSPPFCGTDKLLLFFLKIQDMQGILIQNCIETAASW